MTASLLLDDHAVPTRSGGLVRAGWIVLLLVFGGLGAWSSLAPLSSAVIAPGTLVVDSNRKTLQHLEGGAIRAIHVRDGDRVVAGAPLVELDGERLQVEVGSLQPLLEMNLAQHERLLAEREGRDPDLSKPLPFSGQPAMSAAEARQQRLFQARRASLQKLLSSLESEAAQAEERRTGLKEQMGAQERRIALTKEEQSAIQELAAKGYAPRRRLLELGRALAQQEREQAELRGRVAETEQELNHLHIEKERARTTFEEAVETELQTVEKERAELLARLSRLREQSDRLVVRAPVSGYVVNLAVHTVGGVVQPGASLLDIVPDDDPLVVEARIRPIDVESVTVGMDVQVRLTIVGETILPRLTGKIVTVSADRLVEPMTGRDYFTARIRLTDLAFKELETYKLRAGMPAEVIIAKRSQTVIAYLAAPLTDFLTRAMRS